LRHRAFFEREVAARTRVVYERLQRAAVTRYTVYAAIPNIIYAT
jgi:hypothetical protein